MPEPRPIHATFGKPRASTVHRNRGSCIRIGPGGGEMGEVTGSGFWLTVQEAERLMIELRRAIKRAGGRPDPPEPPQANATAIPA